MKMRKCCVFCGNSPENKNKEHILPQWLIRMTGDPKRIATFGVDFAKQPFAPKQFSFDALAFPACTEYNNSFSHLESAAEPVIRALLSYQAVSAADLIAVLDWLDKVRVGLWLGYFYLDNNPVGITPSFHIQNRMGQLDRMVAIIRLAEPSVGLTFIGPESKFYQLTPTCFALRVNGLCFLNASGVSLCSRRLGFPFAEPVRLRDDHKLEVSYQRGSERVMYPVERSVLLPNIVSLYQPVFRALLESDSAKEYLETDWVSTHTGDFPRGYGKLFFKKDGSARLYPDGISSDWIPSETWKTWEMVNRVHEYVYGRLSKDFESATTISSDKEQRKHMRRQAAMIKMVDRAILQKVRESATRIKNNG
jgi:hypothetical protein